MNFIIICNIVLFVFVTDNHFSKGNVPGINLNFKCGDIFSKYLSKKSSPDGSPVDGTRLFVMYEQDRMWGKCTVAGYECDENINDEWAIKVYYYNDVYSTLRWKTVQYINLLQELNKNKERQCLYTRVVNMKKSSDIAMNSEGGM